MSDNGKRQAGDLTDVEITSEMIEAGVAELLPFLVDADRWSEERTVVSDVFLAMLRASGMVLTRPE